MKHLNSLVLFTFFLCGFFVAPGLYAQDTTLTITGAGNVGIGTTSPAHKLDVNGAINATSFLLNGTPLSTGTGGTRMGNSEYNISPELGVYGSGDRHAYIDFHASDAQTDWSSRIIREAGVNGSTEIATLGTGVLRLRTWTPGSSMAFNIGNIGDVMTLSSNGNVGIGTTSPEAKFEVRREGSGITSILGRGSDASFTLGSFQDKSSNAVGGVLGGFGVSYAGSAMSTGILFRRGFNSNDGSVSFLTDFTERVLINADGKVGIGTTTPSQLLTVNGNICAFGSISSCSDFRYKKDIVPLTDALKNVLKVQGVNYNWKVKEFPDKRFNGKQEIGVIAQELEKIYPELVITGADGYKSVDYPKLTPILVEAVKELNAKVVELQKQNMESQKQFDDLKAMVKSLAAEKNGLGNKSMGELK